MGDDTNIRSMLIFIDKNKLKNYLVQHKILILNFILIFEGASAKGFLNATRRPSKPSNIHNIKRN